VPTSTRGSATGFSPGRNHPKANDSGSAFSVRRIGCDDAELSAAEIADRIRLKIKSNYIYNLARTDDGSTLKF
jgi:hypothetical protein